jgi:uncharacterized spore protein YtfJ
MDPKKLTDQLKDAIGPRRVFGEPVEREGVTLVPAATVIGGGGGGSAPETSPEGGTGLGYGLLAWPTGAYEIRDGNARWIPALDTTRIAVVALIVLAILLRPRRD